MRSGNLRVLHVIESLGSGGAERLLYTNLCHFDPNCIDSKVVTIYSKNEFWGPAIEQLGVPVESLNLSSIRKIRTGIAGLRAIVKEFDPDLIHTHLWGANIIGRRTGKLENVPVVSSIHNPEYEPAAASNASFATRRKIDAARALDAFTARWCGRMIAVSKYVGESAANRLGYPRERITVLYNPVFLSEDVSETDRDSICNDAGIDPSSRILLFVGRLAPQKGLLTLIKAMPDVISKFPDVHLIALGNTNNADYHDAVKDEVERLNIGNHIHLLGERKAVSDYLKNCELFLFPSEFEGLGIALAEAMALGVACIASNIRPLDEFVVNDKNGVLIGPRDSAALSLAIVDLLGDEERRKRLSAAAKDTAISMFDPKIAAERLISIYSEVIDSRE